MCHEVLYKIQPIILILTFMRYCILHLSDLLIKINVEKTNGA